MTYELICVTVSLEHARVHPKFLHSNATSHKWAFGGNFLFKFLNFVCVFRFESN